MNNRAKTGLLVASAVLSLLSAYTPCAAAQQTPRQRLLLVLPGLAVRSIGIIERRGGVKEYVYRVDGSGPGWTQGTYAVYRGFSSGRAAASGNAAAYKDALDEAVQTHIILKSAPGGAAYGTWAVVIAEPALGYCEARTGLVLGKTTLKVSVQRGYSAMLRNNPCVDALVTSKRVTDALLRRLAA